MENNTGMTNGAYYDLLSMDVCLADGVYDSDNFIAPHQILGKSTRYGLSQRNEKSQAEAKSRIAT